jgi:hypothetical protein
VANHFGLEMEVNVWPSDVDDDVPRWRDPPGSHHFCVTSLFLGPFDQREISDLAMIGLL